MSTKYVDVKYTIWNRYHLKDDADIDTIVERLKQDADPDTLYVYSEEESPVYSETLDDTSEFIKAEENDGYATIEVYDESQGLDTIWTNATRTN